MQPIDQQNNDAAKTPEEKPWHYLPPRGFGTLTVEQYIEERITQFRGWYDTKASNAKQKYMVMRTCTVVGGAIVPVLINISGESWMKYITSVISLMVVTLVSLESVYHYREQWKNYRATEQLLAKEYFNFVAAEGPYKGLDAAKAYLILVERVENAIESENASTLNVMTTLSEGKAGNTTNTVDNAVKK